MRIYDMDSALRTMNNRGNNSVEAKAEVDGVRKVGSLARKNSSLTEFEKKEMAVGDKFLIDAIERANKAVSLANRRFEYSIHEKTKEIMVKVIDVETEDVIREIPPEKILDLVATIWELSGIIVDERR